jgi:hypothetical protein
MSYYILPKNNNSININPTITDVSLSYPYISHSLYNYYNDIKEQIMDLSLKEQDISFNIYERMVNPYEFIFSKVPGSKYSVSKLKPATNLFYDFLEISTTLNIFEFFKHKTINTLHITKNHIDSIECFEMIRENYVDNIFYTENTNDHFIKSLNNNSFDFLFFELQNNTTQLYIKSFIDCITIILNFQNKNGISVIKIDNMFYKPIVDLLYLLASLFEKIYIIKPNTSNVTTFDKYIVCKNFILNDNRSYHHKIIYQRLYNVLTMMENGGYLHSIIDNVIPYHFKIKLDDINIIIGQQQLESLDQIINLLKNKNKGDKIESVRKLHIQKSVNWCEKYKIPYNKFTEKINIFLPIIKEMQEMHSIQDLSEMQEMQEIIEIGEI